MPSSVSIAPWAVMTQSGRGSGPRQRGSTSSQVDHRWTDSSRSSYAVKSNHEARVDRRREMWCMCKGSSVSLHSLALVLAPQTIFWRVGMMGGWSASGLSQWRFESLMCLAAPLSSAGGSQVDPPAPRRAHHGSAGIGDSYFPKDGNGGYDVLRYNIHDRYRLKSGHLVGLDPDLGTGEDRSHQVQSRPSACR